jgi:hypothetical protein
MNAWTSWIAVSAGAYLTAWLLYYIVSPKWARWPGRLLMIVWLVAYACAAYAFFTQPRSKGETQWAVAIWIIALVFPPQLLPFHSQRRLRQATALLDDPDSDWRKKGLRLVSKWPRTNEFAHKALIRAAHDDNPDVRRRAVRELGQALEVQGLVAKAPSLVTATLTALGDALNDSNPDVAAAAYQSLLWILKIADLRKWKKTIDDIINRTANGSSHAQATDAALGHEVDESGLSILWKCPHCKVILKKGHPEMMGLFMARGGHLGGDAICAKCHGRTPQAEVYGGKYDVRTTMNSRPDRRDRKQNEEV